VFVAENAGLLVSLRRPRVPEEPASVEVGQGDVVIGGRWHCRISNLLVGERPIAQRLNGILANGADAVLLRA
jgi:hypothetical protein